MPNVLFDDAAGISFPTRPMASTTRLRMLAVLGINFRASRISMPYLKIIFLFSIFGFAWNSRASIDSARPKVVRFPSGELTLGGELYLPEGGGPFPVVVYNHGSAPGMKNSVAGAAIGPKFNENGWAFFMPYRRGQGLSEDQGAYIMDEINAAWWNPFESAAEKLVEMHEGAQLDDQIAAVTWLRKQPFVDSNRIATAGNSFGGIQVMLGMAKVEYCAGINAAGAAQYWGDSDELQELLKRAAVAANGPIFFFQAENDYDVAPSKVLLNTMKNSGKLAKIKIYPVFGSGEEEGHSLPYRGVSIWFEDALQFINEHCNSQELN